MTIEWPDVPVQAQEFGPLPVFHNTCYGNYHMVKTCTCPRPQHATWCNVAHTPGVSACRIAGREEVPIYPSAK
jgi:hypothetical protein